MCEHCGCQALATIAELAREHDAALDLMRGARAAIAAGDRGAAAAASSALLLLLGPHNAVEEQALFVAMHAENPEHVDVLLRQHVEVHDVLRELADGAARDGWQQRLTEALHTLREHVTKEQDGLFPAALVTLTTAQWEAAEQVRSTVGSAHGDSIGTVAPAPPQRSYNPCPPSARPERRQSVEKPTPAGSGTNRPVSPVELTQGKT